MSRDLLLNALVNDIPQALSQELQREVDGAYLQARLETAANPLVGDPERRMLEGVTRFAYLSNRLRLLAARHGLTVVPIQSGNFEVTVIVAGTVAFTLAALRDDRLQETQYREWLANLNRAIKTPGLFDNVAELASVKTYAILFHRRPTSNADSPMVGFLLPDADDATTFEASIVLNVLLEAYPRLEATPAASVPDNVQPRLRRQAAGETGQS